MADVVKATCPNCKRTLRIPADWINKKVRCKHCGAAIRAEPEKKAPAPLPPESKVVKAPASREPKSPPVAPPVSQPPSPDPAEPIIRLPPKAQRSKVYTWVRSGITFGLLATAIILAVVNREHLQIVVQNLRDSVLEKDDSAKNLPTRDSNQANVEQPKASTPIFPRRLLAIFPSQYLFANRVSPGVFDRSFASLLQKFTQALHIDASQTLVLSDEPANSEPPSGKTGKHESQPPAPATRFSRTPPTRALVEKACQEFLAASRPQDRVLVLFIGHIVTIDDKSYLAGLDGDLADKSTLIPFDWLLEKLSQSKARQKVLVIDSFRLDPSRGIDRPASGPMSAAFARALEKIPSGVEVWAPCHPDQYSYEVDGQSIFLDKLCEALQPGTWTAGNKPEEGLPMGGLRTAVDPKVEKEAGKAIKGKQETLWAGKPSEQGANYDAQETLPPRIELGSPPQADAADAADASDVRQILEELKLPPIQVSVTGDERIELDGIFFARDKLAPYLPDYRSLEEIRRQPQKYPLRAAVLETLKLLDSEFGSGDTRAALRQFYPAAGSQDMKNRILNEQKKPAKILLRLQEARTALEKAGEAREDEKAKRWQANYDFAHAELLARIAFLEEYNLMLGKVRKDELPELEKGIDEGWRMIPREKLQSPKDVRDLANQAHKEFAKMIKDYAGTPWEVLARREAATSLGLQWQPAKH